MNYGKCQYCNQKTEWFPRKVHEHKKWVGGESKYSIIKYYCSICGNYPQDRW